MENQPYIAIIDDDHDDSSLLEECFQNFHSFPVRSFYRGTTFFEFLVGNDNYPSLIVVDLNMPEIEGIKVVQRIKENALLKTIPVFVFTTGGTPAERATCQKLNVEIFKKPSSIKEWQSIAFVMAAHCDPRLLKITGM